MASDFDEILSMSQDLIESEKLDIIAQDFPDWKLPEGVWRTSIAIDNGFRQFRYGNDLVALWHLLNGFPFLLAGINSGTTTELCFVDPPLYRIQIHASTHQRQSKIARKGTAVMFDLRKRFPPLTFNIHTGYGRKQLLRALHTILHHGGKEDRPFLWSHLQAAGLQEHAESLGKEGYAYQSGQAELAKRALHRDRRKLSKKKILDTRRQEQNKSSAISKLADLSLSPLKENIPAEEGSAPMEE
ncbi:MAG: hypothetical protein M1821_001811 [Bathelium mastoideum]|nr:MAG: hypothetical protein M1821_001811 [Bathelium mastoideum]KAI9691710.1 MAG: hypothetical protein M1822_007782 [Bathelium mastoideum]